jgi:hypothetical protein
VTGLSKLEIVERHLMASIQMIALEINPITTHVIAMACEEMVLSLADANKVYLDHDYRIYIEDEFHKQYRRKIREPYNLFKHADEAPRTIYDGPSENDLRTVNEIVTMMNASGYRSLGGKNFSKPINAFCATMLMKDPRLFRADWIESNPAVKQQIAYAQQTTHHVYRALRIVLRELNALES